MNWLLLPTLAGYGLAIIGFAGWYMDSKDLKKTRIAYWNERDDKIKARAQRDELNRENESLHQANKNIVTQNADVHAQNADLREALQEAQAEIKALQMNTIEVPEVAPFVMGPPVKEVTPEPVKRTRKKAGAQ